MFDILVERAHFSFSRIDFNQLAKPANLQNSAVLRMLEEEEARQRDGQPSKYKETSLD